MKKRVKSKSSSRKPRIPKQKRHSIPVIIFALVLVFIVYAGLMNILDKLLTTTPGINALAASNSSELASFGSGNMIFSILLIAILFVVFLFFIYKIKLRKKRD